MVKGNGFLSLTGLMLAAGLLVLYLGLCLTGSQRSRSHQAVDGLARAMALDMQQVRQRCVGTNQGSGRWKLGLEGDITAPDGAYERSIVVAAQTGRIRLA